MTGHLGRCFESKLAKLPLFSIILFVNHLLQLLKSFSLKMFQYSVLTSRTVPKLAMVVRIGIRPLWTDMLRVQRYLAHGELMSINMFGKQNKKTMQKFVERARTAACLSLQIFSNASFASHSNGVR